MKKFITPEISFIEVKDADIIATSLSIISDDSVEEGEYQSRESWWD